MSRELESEIAGLVAKTLPRFAQHVRALKAAGASKSQLVQMVTETAPKESVTTRQSLLIAIDEIWKE